MNKDVILECLDELGFRFDEIDNFGYVFQYEGMNMVYSPDSDDDDFFRITVPYIYDLSDESQRPIILDIVNEVNVNVKYSKALLVGDHVWVSYECMILPGDNAMDMVRFGVLAAAAAVGLFYKLVEGDGGEAQEQAQE